MKKAISRVWVSVGLLGGLIFGSQALAAIGGGSSIGLANPAATFCLDLGGTLESVQSAAGEDAKCAVGEWMLFDWMNDRNLTKEHQYPGISMPDPAAVNCLDLKGVLRKVYTPRGLPDVLCVVGEWPLFRATHPIPKE